MGIDWTDPDTLGWVAWILFFLFWEFRALFDEKIGNTLSEHFWYIIGVRSKTGESVLPKATASVKLRRIGVISFGVWLVLHIATGGWV